MTRCPSSSRLTRQSRRSDGSSSTTSTRLAIRHRPPWPPRRAIVARNGTGARTGRCLYGDGEAARQRQRQVYAYATRVGQGRSPELDGRVRCRSRPRATAAARGSSSSGRSTRSRRLSRCGRRAPEPRERLVPAEQLEALVQPRRDLRAGDGDADRLERLARLQAEPLAELLQRGLDRLGVERLDRARAPRPPRRARPASSSAGSGSTSPKRKPAKPGNSPSARSSPARAARPRAPLLVPVVAPARAGYATQASGVLRGGSARR